MDLYEQIVIELAELREIGAARNFLRQTEPMHNLREMFPNRYVHLENLISKTYFDAREAYQFDGTKEKRRKVIANSLSQEVSVAPPSRLLTLLGQSIKWQQHQGLLPPDVGFDLFRGTAVEAKMEPDTVPSRNYATIKLPKKQHAECGAFSPDGQYMVTGTTDGFIEIWNFMTGKLRRDLKYQADGAPMLMEQAVLCASFSRDSELIVTGSHSGEIRVWKLHSGQPVKKFVGAHSQGVTSVCFGKDSTQILSAGFDGLVRLHGMKSGKKIKEFRGHGSFVNSAIFSDDLTRVLSASSDGTIRIWDAKTADCLMTITSQDLKLGAMATNSSLLGGITFNQILPIPKSPEHFLVCSSSNVIHMLNLAGKVVKAYTRPERASDAATVPAKPNPGISKKSFVSISTSSKGEYLYAFHQDGHIYSYSMESAEVVQTLNATEKEPIAILHHPFSSLLATFADENSVKLWKA
ncbi:Serine/threonine-protein kinase smu1, variant 3 [Entomophthora muscae]|nr:Serine/threonine-protein kinase smu1, variant 3 [Entomophthora muscae]